MLESIDSFSQRYVNKWNKLSSDCVNASRVNMFKNRIDKCLIRAGYTSKSILWTLDKPTASVSAAI